MNELAWLVDPRFSDLERVFREVITADRGGASFAVYWRGKCVASLFGGDVGGHPWGPDTLVPLTSLGKAVLSTLLLRAVEAKRIELDAPIAQIWPEFATRGKGGITLRMFLAHRAGLPTFPRPVTLADEFSREALVDAMCNLEPEWRPNSQHGYHAVTFNYLAAELLNRVWGRNVASLVDQMLARPLGADITFRLKSHDVARLAGIVPATPQDAPSTEDLSCPPTFVAASKDPHSLFTRATTGSIDATDETVRATQYLLSPRPAGFATAEGVARVFDALVSEQRRVLSQETVAAARSVHSSGFDKVFQFHTRFGLGFMLPDSPLWGAMPGEPLGHIGSAGALAFGDPDHQLAFAFLPSRAKHLYELPDRRAMRLAVAAYSAALRAPAAD